MNPPQQSGTGTPKMAPVQGYAAGIPWEMHLRAYDAYCKRWGPQPALIDLQGRNCRGGFDTIELDGFIPGWRDELSAIKKLEAQLQAKEQELAEANELRIMQLAGISTASIQNTVTSIKDRITSENPYYTTAYSDVCRTVDREMELRQQLAARDATIAGLRDALEDLGEVYVMPSNWDYAGQGGGPTLEDCTKIDLTDLIAQVPPPKPDAPLLDALRAARCYMDIDAPQGLLAHLDALLDPAPPDVADYSNLTAKNQPPKPDAGQARTDAPDHTGGW